MIWNYKSTSINHYTAFILNNKREINGLLKNKNYFYDGFTNDNKIIEFNNQINLSTIEYLINYNPLILIYLKK